MSPSEDETEPLSTVETLVDRLDTESETETVAAELARTYVGNTECFGEEGLLSDEQIETLLPYMDAPDPRVRGHITAVVRQSLMLKLFYAESPVGSTWPANYVLDRADDEDWRVRQTALLPTFGDELAGVAVDGDDDGELGSRLASVLVERLDDPVATVRKRAGEILVGRGRRHDGYDSDTFAHAAELFLHHPSPDEAIPTLIVALSDSVDDVPSTRGRSPRHTVGSVLVALREHRPDLLEPYTEQLREMLGTDDEEVRIDVVEALGSVSPRTVESLCPVVDAAGLLLDAEREDRKIRAAETLDRVATDVPEWSSADQFPWDGSRFTDACIDGLQESYIDNCERAAELLGRWLGRLDEQDADRALSAIRSRATERPEHIISTLGGVLDHVQRRGATSRETEIIELLAEEAPDRASEEIERRGGATTFPDEITEAVRSADS